MSNEEEDIFVQRSLLISTRTLFVLMTVGLGFVAFLA
jgi:hypothetical protein